jgi:pimeloyl-ACP methyl ester carboxylesterase
VSYANIHGLSMYYEDVGRGRPLILLHGGGSTAQTSFGAIMPALARSRRLIAPEQQGFGHTADIDRPLTFAQMADDTAALLDHLGVREPADVMGFSAGGVAAMELAMRHPARVRRLVLGSTFYARDGLPAPVWEGIGSATPDHMPAVLRDALFEAAPRREDVPRMFARQVEVMMTFRDLDEAKLRALAHPALILLGDADVMSLEHAAALGRLLTGSQIAVFPGSAHGTYIGALEGRVAGSHLPDIAVAMIEAFLGAD